MKLKSGLILREIAGQYVIVPTGKRVSEITKIVYISSSAAFLWNYMQEHEFEKDDLVRLTLENYDGVTKEKASEDIDKFLKILSNNNILDDGKIHGRVFVKIPKEMLNNLWPPKKMGVKNKDIEDNKK